MFERICEILFEHYNISFLKYENRNDFVKCNVLHDFNIFNDVFVD